MNHVALLALVSDLYAQLLACQAQLQAVVAERDALRDASRPSPSPSDGSTLHPQETSMSETQPEPEPATDPQTADVDTPEADDTGEEPTPA